VATYARCGGILNNDFTADLPRNLPVKKSENRLRFDRIMAMSLWPHFFGPHIGDASPNPPGTDTYVSITDYSDDAERSWEILENIFKLKVK